MASHVYRDSYRGDGSEVQILHGTEKEVSIAEKASSHNAEKHQDGAMAVCDLGKGHAY